MRLHTAVLYIFIFASMFAARPLNAASSSLLITEVYYNAFGEDAKEEWIELTNFSNAAVEVGSYKLGDEETAGGQEGMMRFPSEAIIEPQQTVVVAQSAAHFRARYGRWPDFEMQESAADIPNMRHFPILAGGDVALSNSGDEVILMNSSNKIVDALSYGESSHFFLPAIVSVPAGNSIERAPADCDSDTAADWKPQPSPDPGRVNSAGECAAELDPTAGLEIRPIGEIQGEGDESPLLNQIVTLQGIVTAVHADRNASGVVFYTLYVQNRLEQADAEATTADAIPVFLGRAAPEAKIGDEVLAQGQVTEFFGLTELDEFELTLRILSGENPLPEAITLNVPAKIESLEALEGMRVKIDTAVVVGPTFEVPSGCGFAVVPTELAAERPIRHSLEDETSQVVQILHADEENCEALPNLKTGDRVRGIVGPLTYNFDEFKIVLQDPELLEIEEAAVAPVPTPPQPTAQQVSLVSYNLENFFDSVDDTGNAAEPKPSSDEIIIKQQKIAATISDVLGCPTLIGVQEVEKEALLLALAAELETACGFRYAVTHRESFDGRGIDNALLSDPNRITIQSATLAQGCSTISTGLTGFSCPTGEDPLLSRPPLQVELTADGTPLTLFINHLKSKREGEQETAARRFAQASHLARVVDDLHAQGKATVVLGDFNDYADSETLRRLQGDGRLINLLRQLPEGEQYTFIFGGVSQLIDGILVSPQLTDSAAHIEIVHTNADYPDSMGSDISAASLIYRSGDHDIPYVIFDLPQKASEATVAPTDAPTAVPNQTPTPETIPAPTPERAKTAAAPIWLFATPLILIGIASIWLWKRRSSSQN